MKTRGKRTYSQRQSFLVRLININMIARKEQLLKKNKAKGTASQFLEAVLPAMHSAAKCPTHFLVTANVIVRLAPDR